MTTTPECGTFAGYKHHRRQGQPADQPCKDANAARSREWRSANWRTVDEMDAFAVGRDSMEHDEMGTTLVEWAEIVGFDLSTHRYRDTTKEDACQS